LKRFYALFFLVNKPLALSLTSIYNVQL